MKYFYERGILDSFWIEEYCLKNNPRCVRKKMESQRISHPDNMLPDGTIREDLKD